VQSTGRNRKPITESPSAQRCLIRTRSDGETSIEHFRGDRRSPAKRFDFLRDQLGDAFIAIELDDADANPAGVLSPHSVLTEHLIDEPGQPTQAALHQVLDFLRSRLVLDRPPAPHSSAEDFLRDGRYRGT